MKSFLGRVLLRKKFFVAVDIGSNRIKVAGIRTDGGIPRVAFLYSHESPPGVWTEQFDEEGLVGVLSRVRSEGVKEVISCIGGEKVLTRTVRFPLMSEKELAVAAENEMEKYLSSLSGKEQFIFRYVRLDGGSDEVNDKEKGMRVLLLAVPAAAVYQYYGIFSRAGLLVTAFDLQAFALWRLFGRDTSGTLAIIDIGSRASHLVITRNSRIRFVRVLPVGGDGLWKRTMDIYESNTAETRQAQEDANLLKWSLIRSKEQEEILSEKLLEIAGEINRSLNFYTIQEGDPVEQLILSGGGSKVGGLAAFLENILGIPVRVGTADLPLPEGDGFDPAYAVALGLALRGVC
ncbi:MAG: pilus assembly protein PilM [Thermacetogeniaceae bacterium]